MRISYRITTDSRKAPVAINCPACAATGASAQATQTTERLKLLGVIPLLKLTNTWVECGRCHKTFFCSARLDQIADAPPSQIAPFLRYRVSTAANILSIIALVTSIVPVIGLILAAVAMVTARGTKGWAAIINFVSMIIAATITGTVVILAIIRH